MMAAAAIPGPGTEYGPCKGGCGHTDCAASRAQAAVKCVKCEKKIGYEVLWWFVDGKAEHYLCTEGVR